MVLNQSKLHFVYLLILLSQVLTYVAIGAEPLFPEDGSKRVSFWYFSSSNRHFNNHKVWSELLKISSKHNFELRSIGNYYNWMQDALLFDQNGTLLVMAPYSDQSFLDGINIGIARSWDDDQETAPLRITPDSNFKFKSYRQLSATFVEGGNLISGRLKNGKPYVLVDQTAVIRAQKYLSHKLSNTVTYDYAKKSVARDLGVEPKHLYELKTYKHLDLILMPLPGGKILLHDPQKTSSVLKEYAGIHNHASHIKDFETDKLSEIEDKLNEDFEVIRVAGAFENLGVNFFNSFQGLDENGVHWQITNSANEYKGLETYWRKVIKTHSPRPNTLTYFVGIYSTGAGINCSGAVSP